MLSKKQKIWLGIFGTMFVVPEILFSFVLSIVVFLGITINPLYSFFINHQFFIDHSNYLLIANTVEWAGVLGLLVMSWKFKRKILVILLGIILLWLSIELYLGYIISNMSLVF